MKTFYHVKIGALETEEFRTESFLTRRFTFQMRLKDALRYPSAGRDGHRVIEPRWRRDCSLPFTRSLDVRNCLRQGIQENSDQG
jgi:hypothetical protein